MGLRGRLFLPGALACRPPSGPFPPSLDFEHDHHARNCRLLCKRAPVTGASGAHLCLPHKADTLRTQTASSRVCVLGPPPAPILQVQPHPRSPPPSRPWEGSTQQTDVPPLPSQTVTLSPLPQWVRQCRATCNMTTSNTGGRCVGGSHGPLAPLPESAASRHPRAFTEAFVRGTPPLLRDRG